MTTNADMMARLQTVECRDATYRPVSHPLVMERGQGSLVWDVEGREYIDLCAGFGVMALGHSHDVTRRIDAPLIHGMGDVYPSRAKVELLEALTRALPAPLSIATLALSGSQAVEAAVKTALLKTKRSGFIVFDGSYHGVDLGILALTSREDFKAPFKRWIADGNVQSVPFGADATTLAAAVAALKHAGHELAAVLVEPVQGRAGVRPAPAGWLATLRRFCDDQGALLIYDEVFTGMGRTGKLTHAADVPCDLLCLGKAMGGGMPISACVGTKSVMDAWPECHSEALHTGTFFGHPLSCTYAAATLAEILAADLPRRATRVGDQWQQDLRTALRGVSSVKEVRGVGLMLAIEFKEAGAGAKAMDLLRERGVIALASSSKGESLSLTPALNIPEALLADATQRLVAVAKLV
jgi:acetylornithine/succinyldiaminopimelate/putrescine aminotransferase